QTTPDPTPATEYTVHFNLNGHGATIADAQTVDGKITAPTAPTDNDYDFGGWYTDADCTTAFDFNTVLTAETTIYAKWTAKQTTPDPTPATEYTVHFNLNGHGATIADAQTVDGKITAPTAPTDNDYDFGGWYTDAACTTAFDFNTVLTAETTIYAKWTAKQTTPDPTPATEYTVHFNLNGHGTEIDDKTTVDGKVAKPTDPSDENYDFGGWYTDAACTTAFDFDTELTAETTLYAKWTAKVVDPTPDPEPVTEYTVHFNLNGHGAEIADEVTVDGKVTKPTDPTDSSYEFGGWYDNAACTGTAIDFDTTVFTQNTTVYAKWTAINIYDRLTSQANCVFSEDCTDKSDMISAENDGATVGIFADSATASVNFSYSGGKLVQTTSGANSGVTISFGAASGDIEGYFEVTPSDMGSKWRLVSIVDNGSNVFSVYTTAKGEPFKYVLSGYDSNTSPASDIKTPESSITASASTLYKVYYKLVWDGTQYVLTMTINGSAFVTDFALGVSNVDGIYLISSNSGARKLTLDNIVVCTELSKEELISKLDKEYSLYTFVDGESPATHSINGAQVTAAYNTAKAAIGAAASIDQAYEAYKAGVAEMAAVESDAEVKADRAAAVEALEAYKSTSFTLEENSTAYQNAVSAGKAAINAATNSADITSALNQAKAAIDGIKTDDQVNAEKALANAKATATAELDAYRTSDISSCSSAIQSEIATVISTAKAAIANASTVEQVNTLLAQAKADIDLKIAAEVVYTIKFDLNGHGSGTIADAQTVDGKVTAPADPTDSGYNFRGWYDNAECSGVAVDLSTKVFAANTTLYAKWVVKVTEHTVTYDMQGHGTQIAQAETVDGKVIRPEDPSESGYTFGGWYEDADCTQAFDFAVAINSNKTLYAKWTEIISETPDVPESNTINVLSCAGDLEAAYVTWEAVSGASWYNVYVKANGSSKYVQLDGELVRQYPTYYRADAVGLKAGGYSMKIVATDKNGDEIEEKNATVSSINVLAHDRSGYAFVNGTSSGAYNDDGSLKSDAVVLYITQDTKDTITLDVTTSSKGAVTNCIGLQAILTAFKKGYDTRPLDVRLIGNITDLAAMEKGDILIDGTKYGVTFEGIGSDATANGWGLRIKGATNVEVRNLGFMNCDSDEGDNIGLQQDNDHIWVHNCDLFYGDAGSDKDQAKGDGALDTKKSTYVTHSYNHFWDSGKCNLQGMTSETTSNYITYHHNWYDHSDSRHPRIRTCTVHIYNNYFDGNAKYGVGVTLGASAFVENNYFRSTATMKPMLSSMQGTDALGEGTFSSENGGMIKAYGNVYDGAYSLITQNDTEDKTNLDCYAASTRDEQVPSDYTTKQGGTTYNNFDTAADFYTYTVDSAEEAKAKIEKYAGRIGGGDFQYEFNDKTEDSNYAVIDELKTMLTNYTGTLVKVGDSSEGGSFEDEEAIEYTVSFNLNGHGTGSISSKTTVSGKVSAPTSPTDENYDFGGWYENADCTGTAVNFDTKVFTADTTLYAKWTEKASSETPVTEYKVSFNLNGHGTGTIASQTTVSGMTTAPTAPTDTNYEFGGWYTTSACSGEAINFTTYTFTADTTVYAKWTAKVTVTEHTVTFDMKGIGTQIESITTVNGLVTKPTDPVADGYTFKGWYEDSACTQGFDFTVAISSNKTLYAKWEEIILPEIPEDAKISIYDVEGSNESAYLTWKPVEGASTYNVYYKESEAISYTKIDGELIRAQASSYRADLVGLSAGTYSVKIVAVDGSGVENAECYTEVSNVSVAAYDRSGYAHFNYTDGVGAYNDDGTLKDNALVLYVTDENKNTLDYGYVNGNKVDLSAYLWNGNKGIGWILNNRAYSSERANYGIQKLTDLYGSVVVRFIGNVNAQNDSDCTVSLIEGLTAYDSTDNGGSVGDNGRMARMTDAKNLTLEGIGDDATIRGWGFHFISSTTATGGQGKGFEVRNLTFTEYPEDAIGMEGQQEGSTITSAVERCWIHNNVFLPGRCDTPAAGEDDKKEGDGSCDFKRGMYFTCSYNYFEYCHKTNLVGSSDSSLQFNMTYHHNMWYQCGSRIPLTRQANVHFYNNYVYANAAETTTPYSWISKPALSYVHSLRANCYLFSEANYYDGCKNVTDGKTGGAGKAWGNMYYACFDTNTLTEATSREQKVSNSCAYGSTDYSSFDTNPDLFYYDAVNKRSDCYITDAVTARKVVIEKVGVQGFSPRVSVDMLSTKPSSALSIPEGGLTIDLSKATAGGTVDGVLFINATNSSSVAKGKGILAAFTLAERAEVSITATASGDAVAELLKTDGTVIAGKFTSYSGTLEPGTYIISSGQKDKECSITSLSFKSSVTDAEKVQGVIDYIAAIGTVEYTDECKAKIELAQSAYNALGVSLQAQVTNASVLTEAADKYDELAADSVEAKIEAIGTVTEDSGKAISAARTAYDALTSSQKAKVTNYAVLTAAESAFEGFAVSSLQKSIDALPDVATLTTEAELNSALEEYTYVQTEYEGLGEEQKALISGYSKVTDGITAIQTKLAPYTVKNMIAALPAKESVALSDSASITAARNAYDALTSEQQASVGDITRLTEAEAVLEELASKTIVAIFTNDDTSLATNAGFTVSGSYKSGVSFVYDEVAYNSPLKLESSTSVTFSTAAESTLTIKIYSAGGQLKVDGTTYVDSDSDGFITVENLAAGSHTITKASGDPHLCYVIIGAAS
ncbi:MAG: InlB B-repeat-containing protein, partial [Candidatus Coproplasma sp.]